MAGRPTPVAVRSRALVLTTALLVLFFVPAGAQAQAPSTSPDSPWTLTVRDLTRLETWRFFEPPTDGPDPTYGFLANRLQLEARGQWPKAVLTVTAQHVGFLGLPESSAGPGPFGTGALYYAQGGNRRNPQQLYLRYANVLVRDVAPGLEIQAGRMAYSSGAEQASGVAKIEAVKRQRLFARLVGEFEWSIYQRSFDGVRVDWTRADTRVTGIAFMPTQGGFAQKSGRTMTDITVLGGTISHTERYDTGGTQVQGFVVRYDDDRPTAPRADNSGRAAAPVDIGVTTVGATLLGAYTTEAGEVDLFAWAALQDGHWYGEPHRAAAVAAEAGFQWTAATWRPWLRTGFIHASGDDDAADDRHGTFFPMLPTMRRFSQTTAYSTMNLREVFVQTLLQPRSDLSLRLDLHRLWLASGEDRWYAGSGATLTSGGGVGFAGRPSNGETGLGTVVEGSANYTVNPHWSVNGFVGFMRGGPVVTGTFDGANLWFAYVENVLAVSR